jgi:Uma2 family endonuclease
MASAGRRLIQRRRRLRSSIQVPARAAHEHEIRNDHWRAPIITARAVEGPPDLVVEIVSPSTSRKDRLTKAAPYARFGIPCYWLLDPEQRLFDGFVLEGAVYRLATRRGHDEAVQAEPFVDLAISLSNIWPRPL